VNTLTDRNMLTNRNTQADKEFHQKPNSFYLVGLTGLLALLATTGNLLNLPLFFGVAFIFGSIFVMLALVLVGRLSAVVVALIGGLYTVVLWNQPYSLIIYTCEAVVVGQIYLRYTQNLIIADLIYWLCVGIPLCFLFYGQLLEAGWEEAFLLSIKETLNGVFNALLAGLIIIGLQLSSSLKKITQLKTVEFSSIVFHVLLTGILFAGAAPIIYESHGIKTTNENFVAERLADRIDDFEKHFNNQRYVSFNLLLNDMSTRSGMSFTLLDHKNQIIKSVGDSSYNQNKKGTRTRLDNGLSIWLPAGDMGNLERWKQGYYQKQTTFMYQGDQVTLVVEYPAKMVVTELETGRRKLFIFLACLFGLGFLVAKGINRLLIQPLTSLEVASRSLSNQIASGYLHNLPQSNIKEYVSLSNSLTDMATLLARYLQQQRDAQQLLEQRVTEHTEELRSANEMLLNVLSAARESAIMAIDRDYNFTIFNTGAQRLLGYDESDMLGIQTPEVFHLQEELTDRANFLSKEFGYTPEGLRVLVEKSEREGSDTAEWTYVHKDGHWVTVSVVVTSMHDAYGAVSGYLFIAHDVSNRKQDEKNNDESIAVIGDDLRSPKYYG
jgi:PAS domain S-box-containing protein